MTDAYADPWRERGQWWGDAYVDSHINRVAFGDTALLARGLFFLGEAFTEDGRPPAFAPNWDGTHLLDYGMLWVQSLHHYWVLTADVALPRQVYSALQRFMAYLASYEDVTTGLLYVPAGKWYETALVDWRGGESRRGASTALNALYYGTLVDAASIAEVLGDLAAAQAWRDRAAAVRERSNTYLFSLSDRRYSATILDEQVRPATAHAQAWALAYGLVPEGEIDHVADALVELVSADPSAPNVEIYGMFWVLEALGRSGRIDEALHLIKSHYGHMLAAGASTWWETFGSGERYRESLSHGWGGAPTWFLSTYVLGARRTGPSTWMVKPAFAGVELASGSLPLGDGMLKVDWNLNGCEETTLGIGAPAGSRGEAVIPLIGADTFIALNDVAIWRDGGALSPDVTAQADGLHVSLAGGDHRFAVRGGGCSADSE
jgi:alpha-L-rhamnosidase